MSKAIRIREHLYAEIAERAQVERRSIIGQLEYLLEQALRLPGSDGAVQAEPASKTARRTLPPAAPSEDSGGATEDVSLAGREPERSVGGAIPPAADPHSKPYFEK